MVTALWVMVAAVAAPGARVELGWTSSSGPDHYGTMRVEVVDGSLRSGAWLVGGTRSAALGVAGGAWSLGRGELAARGILGVVRSSPADPAGATGGCEVHVAWPAGSGTELVADVGGVAHLGWRAAAGVDRELGARWVVTPRLRAETWAGDADPALRAELGVRAAIAGWTLEVAGSAGGRDVLHVGPGLTIALGRY